jgi:hypothetical protein
MLHTKTNASYMERLTTALNAEIGKGKQVRRWSFEIEANYLGASYWELRDLGRYDLKGDSSVNYLWTDCDCDTCNHDCNCERCDRDYYDSDPCEESQIAEVAPLNHYAITTADGDTLAEVCRIIKSNGGSVDESTGGHIHIDAQDMTIKQIANLMRVWDRVQELLPELVGRSYQEAQGYADPLDRSDIERMERGDYPPRSCINAINAYNYRLSGEWHKNTIEFRQFSGTLDSGLIQLRGLVARRLVEYFEKGNPPYYLMNAKDANQVLSELGL